MTTLARASVDQSNFNSTLSANQASVINEEELALDQVTQALYKELNSQEDHLNLDDDLLELRDQIQEARSEDQAALIEHMNRLAALQQTRADRDTATSDEELIDSPYFARLIYEEENEEGESTGRKPTVYIGKRSFFSKDGRVKVIDWRSSPMSKLYYTLREGDYFYEELGVRVVSGIVKHRRTLTVRASQLQRIQYGTKGDQFLQKNRQEIWGEGATSIARLEGGERSADRPIQESLKGTHHGGLPDITALIDPEQFGLITQERSGVVIIQGGAGTGKTTIALHRVAYLHFHNPQRFAPKKCLVIAPGEALKRYVERSLPSLDLNGVLVSTFSDWSLHTVKRLIPKLKRYKIHDDTPPGASRLKRHPLILKLIEERVYAEGRLLDRKFKRVGGEPLLNEWVKRRSLPLIQRLIKLREHVQLNNLVKNSVSRVITEALEQVSDPFSTWIDLLTDSDFIEETFKNRQQTIYQWELKQLKWLTREQSMSKERFDHLDADYQVGVDHKALESSPFREVMDADDCAIILRICQLKWGKLSTDVGSIIHEHIMVDEAQDLSPVALRVLCDATPANAPVTLAGDTAQRIVFDNGFSSWKDALKFLPSRSVLLPPLTISYRSTRQVMYLARYLLGDLVHDWHSRDFREGAPVGYLRYEERGEGIAFLSDALTRLMRLESNATVAIVTRTKESAIEYYQALKQVETPKLRLVIKQDFLFTPGIDVTEVRQVKGLEYDYIIALDVDQKNYPDKEESRHLLHVIATRAAHQLWLMTLGEVDPSPLLPKKLLDEGELDTPLDETEQNKV